MKKLQTSGYDHDTQIQVLKSIKNGWQKILEKDRTGERPLHRNREFNRDQRRKDKEDKKLNWYKGKSGNAFDSVMMVAATPNSELKKIIEEKARIANLRIKIVEKSGMKLGSYIKKFDKTNKKGPCKENDCLICKNSNQNT